MITNLSWLTRQIFSRFYRRPCVRLRGLLTITIKGQPQPAPHELRPIHFINRGASLPRVSACRLAKNYRIVMFGKPNFHQILSRRVFAEANLRRSGTELRCSAP